MKKIIVFFMLVAGLVSFISCKDNTPVAANPTPTLGPVEVTYKVNSTFTGPGYTDQAQISYVDQLGQSVQETFSQMNKCCFEKTLTIPRGQQVSLYVRYDNAVSQSCTVDVTMQIYLDGTLWRENVDSQNMYYSMHYIDFSTGTYTIPN